MRTGFGAREGCVGGGAEDVCRGEREEDEDGEEDGEEGGEGVEEGCAVVLEILLRSVVLLEEEGGGGGNTLILYMLAVDVAVVVCFEYIYRHCYVKNHQAWSGR